jgi:hypothetical protein
LKGKIMGGNPVFRGTRVPVHMLAELVPSRACARTPYRRGSVTIFSLSSAAMRTLTISTDCAAIRRSSSPAGGCPTRVSISARSRPSRDGRTHPSLRVLIRLMGVMVDLYCASYAVPPTAVTLDIDDTVNVDDRPLLAPVKMPVYHRFHQARPER